MAFYYGADRLGVFRKAGLLKLWAIGREIVYRRKAPNNAKTILEVRGGDLEIREP
jgi:hypothetical protein